jgi:hypothetical protein
MATWKKTDLDRGLVRELSEALTGVVDNWTASHPDLPHHTGYILNGLGVFTSSALMTLLDEEADPKDWAAVLEEWMTQVRRVTLDGMVIVRDYRRAGGR